ncbi:hypothetical protein G4G27_02300 [Sphingomonas sp. So64.6b]|uniref:hypothetical protein n=1 Tax=Sphingomonas sp. So64.6b TaxID=2997354 RepID=UPI001602018E|nr:hypothetical protein [Sphingomonas sp. So64.6b]QNA82974.1 hypothetical protein G4G27_02300 [Sphingomonas sp. So64.6b]
MKKILIAAAVSVIASASPAFANTANTTVYAQISAQCDITSPGTTLVALSGATELGNIGIICNSAQGFTATAQSLHAGKLVDETNHSGTAYDYVLNVDGVGDVALDGTYNQVFGGNNGQFINGITLGSRINVTGATGPAYAGVYQDTISFSITAN